MRRILFLGLMCAIASAVNAARCDEPTTAPKTAAVPKSSPDDIDRWIQELNAPEFATRETATRRLIAAGPTAAESLVKAAQTGDITGAMRHLGSLRTYLHDSGTPIGDRDSLKQASRASEQLGLKLMSAFSFLIPVNYKAIEAAEVAQALHHMVKRGDVGVRIATSGVLSGLARAAG